MSLLCIKCKNPMELVDEYNPPYPEPCEKVYYCSECNIEALDNECYGIEYYDKKTHYRIVESKGE